MSGIGEDFDKEKPFTWTEELTAMFMESFFIDRGNGELILFSPENEKNFFQPLRILTCYIRFCKCAFKGNTPKDFIIEVFEEKIRETFHRYMHSSQEVKKSTEASA